MLLTEGPHSCRCPEGHNGPSGSDMAGRNWLKIGKWVEHIEAALLQGPSARLSALSEAGTRELQEFIAAWREVSERDVNFGLRQKGVDMRIGRLSCIGMRTS